MLILCSELNIELSLSAMIVRIVSENVSGSGEVSHEIWINLR
jgi:hypothetical protein